MFSFRFLPTTLESKTTLPVLVAILVLAATGGTGSAQTLQEAIDQASPGDTVFVAPGDYSRPVTVDKAITLLAEGPGEARLGGISGSLALVVGLVLDGSLGTRADFLVQAGSGLRFNNCTFRSSFSGAQITSGAKDVLFRDCYFNALLEAVNLEEGAVSVTLDGTEVVDCTLGLIGPDSLVCDTPSGRVPAERCDGGPCGRIEILNSTFVGGARHLMLAGDYVLIVRDSEFRRASTTALRAAGVRFEMERCEVASTGGGFGTGLDLDSVSGFVRSSRILSRGRGIMIGDGGCHRYSDIVIGGTLLTANDISNLRLEQPEAVNAEANFWGTQNCVAALAVIDGQAVQTITDDRHQILIDCSMAPAEPTTWGRLKTRYETGGGP